MRIMICVRPAKALRGEVSVDGGPARPFTGWLQLLSILGELLPRHEAGPTTPGRAGPDAGPE